MPYDQIVFIGYVIDTAPKKNLNGSETYLGLPVAAEDIAARCELLAGALATARAALPAPSSPPANTLYVFAMPEFFFRGKTGAYAMDDVQLAIAALQNLAADGQWDDWVFEFGTIVGQYAAADPNQPIQICNFALVQQGGVAAQGPDGARAIVKQLKSGIDFIAADANPGGLLLGAVEHPDSAPPGPGKERQQVAYDGAGIFGLLGFTWATEICLDHLEARLQQSPQLPGESEVQIQLVPSCGADVEASGIIAETGGYIFNTDGFRKQAHARLVRVAAPLQQMPRAVSKPVNITQVTLPNLSPPQIVPVGDLYANGAGSLWIYDPVPLPPVRRVPGSTDSYLWKASVAPRWTFTFYLIYDHLDTLSSVLCKVQSNEIDFQGNKYELPLVANLTFALRPTDSVQRTGSLEIELKPGGSYDYSIYGRIQVPGFNFEGEIMRFMADKNSPEQVEQIW